MYYIETEKELADALNKKQESFEIEGALKDNVLKIKNTGMATWMVALSAISFASSAALTTTKVGKIVTPLTLPIATFTAIGAIPILGIPATTSAIAIAVASGGIGVLHRLRKYKIIQNDKDKLVLQRS
jgi:cellulase/cellobiase CelA1